MWREATRFDDAIGFFPIFIDCYCVFILPTTGALAPPYRALVPNARQILFFSFFWWQEGASGRRQISHASARNMNCCSVSDKAPASPRPPLQRNEIARSIELGAYIRIGPARRALRLVKPRFRLHALVGAGAGRHRGVRSY